LTRLIIQEIEFQYLQSLIIHVRIGCIERVIKDEADFLPLEPEEIFVAQRFRRNAFSVIAEIRSEEFKDRELNLVEETTKVTI